MSLAENVEPLSRSRVGNYEVTRFNALCHGVLSRHTVLPWEDGEEYRSLLEAFVAEHNPRGPTEEHLVEELAGIVWRKRRLRLGENAAHHRALMRASDPYQHTAKAALINVAADLEVDWAALAPSNATKRVQARRDRDRPRVATLAAWA